MLFPIFLLVLSAAYAFTYVALYGQTYCDAGRSVVELFTQRGIDAVINDDLTGLAMAQASFMGGLMACGGMIAVTINNYVRCSNSCIFQTLSSCESSLRSLQNSFTIVILAFAAFFVGLVLTMNAMVVIRSCVASLFVCFAEDPAALAQSHPVVFEKFVRAWSLRYPDIYLVGYRV